MPLAFMEKAGNFLKENVMPYVPVIGQFFQNQINAAVQRENVNKTILANAALARYQYSKDLEMWNRGNVYNSPIAQMGRLKAAGLNPNMVYGSGSAAGMAAGQLPKYNAPTVDYSYTPAVDIPSMIAAFQNFRLGNAQIRKAQLDSEAREFPVEGPSGEVMPFYESLGHARLNQVGYDWRIKNMEYERRRDLAWVNMPKYQRDLIIAQQAKTKSENARIIAATRNLDLQNEYFAARAITGMFGNVASGMGVLGRSIGMGIRKAGQKGSGAKAPKMSVPKLDPSNKSWQKEFESHRQWMKRVNPGAK